MYVYTYIYDRERESATLQEFMQITILFRDQFSKSLKKGKHEIITVIPEKLIPSTKT